MISSLEYSEDEEVKAVPVLIEIYLNIDLPSQGESVLEPVVEPVVES